jgi:hypothetical protein
VFESRRHLSLSGPILYSKTSPPDLLHPSLLQYFRITVCHRLATVASWCICHHSVEQARCEISLKAFDGHSHLLGRIVYCFHSKELQTPRKVRDAVKCGYQDSIGSLRNSVSVPVDISHRLLPGHTPNVALQSKLDFRRKVAWLSSRRMIQPKSKDLGQTANATCTFCP